MNSYYIHFPIPRANFWWSLILICLMLALTDWHIEPTLPSAEQKSRLGLSFVPNRGQSEPFVHFHVQSQAGTLFFMSDEVLLRLARSEQAEALRLHFEGANPNPELAGNKRLSGVVNYFIGNDPAKWRTNLPTYAAVTYKELYRGIDLRYDGTEGLLKGTYLVAPHADPTGIRWRYEGATTVKLDETTGHLLITTGTNEAPSLIEEAPIAWQTIKGQRVNVSSRYVVTDGTVSFALGAYDPTQPLIIDPTITYATYLGGSDDDNASDIAIDQAGNIYLTGSTASIDFPTPGSSPQAGFAGYTDAFVSKINAAGDELIYSSYLGGSYYDGANAIAIDNAGNASITGYTRADFPIVNPGQPGHGGGDVEAFVTKLNATGDALIYSTYLGGRNEDIGKGITSDTEGNTYVTGYTTSTDFFLVKPLQKSKNGSTDAFVAAFSPTGSLLYSTYLGGSEGESGQSIVVNSAGQAYLTGDTNSSDFPNQNPLQRALGGGLCGSTSSYPCDDIFVVKLNTQGDSLLYSTYFGGSGTDGGSSIAIDRSSNIYVTGSTASEDFPTLNAWQSNHGGDADPFVIKFSPDDNELIYSTYLGGSLNDGGYGIAVDRVGNAYVTGYTASADFPTVNSLQDDGYGSDAFVAKLSPLGDDLTYSTYLGGNHRDGSSGIAVDSVGTVYLTGYTSSTDFPTQNPYQAVHGGDNTNDDAFVVRLGTTHRLYLPVVRD